MHQRSLIYLDILDVGQLPEVYSGRGVGGGGGYVHGEVLHQRGLLGFDLLAFGQWPEVYSGSGVGEGRGGVRARRSPAPARSS